MRDGHDLLSTRGEAEYEQLRNRSERPAEEEEDRRPRRQAGPAPAPPRAVHTSLPRRDVRGMLASREALCRAIIVHEVLGPPRALRGWDEARPG